MDEPRRRPRSTIVPGRRMNDSMVLHMMGMNDSDDDDSYRNIRTDPTDSDVSVRSNPRGSWLPNGHLNLDDSQDQVQEAPEDPPASDVSVRSAGGGNMLPNYDLDFDDPDDQVQDPPASDVSVRSNPGATLPNYDLDLDDPAEEPAEDPAVSDVSMRSDPGAMPPNYDLDLDDTQEGEEEAAQPPRKKKKMEREKWSGGMLLEKQPIHEAPGATSPSGRPCRNRCPPVRWWLGEEPIYKWSNGYGELQGITDVVIHDKTACKYRTANPITIVHLMTAEKKKKRNRKRTHA